MARRRRGSVADGLEMFAKTYSLTQKLRGDYAVHKGMKDAEADAAESGGTTHTLDKGMDDKGMADYQSKDKADIDMVSRQEDDIASMQADINAEKAGPSNTSQMATALQPAGQSTGGLGDVAPTQTQPGLAATQGMAQALNPSATDSQIANIEKSPAMAAPAPAAPEGGYVRGEIETPKLDTMDIFHKKYAPKVTAELMKQGNMERAKEFETWARSEKGARYGDTWLKGMMQLEGGDVHGGMMAVQDLYNKQLPDGQYAIAKPGKGGEYTIEVRDEKTNKLVGSKTGDGKELGQMAYGMLSPKEAFTSMVAQQTAATKRKQEIEDRDAKINSAERIADKKESPSTTLSKLIRERDALDPKDPQYKQKLALYNDAITKTSTRGEGGGNIEIKISPTPQDMAGGGQGVVVTDPKKRSAGLVPLSGAPNAVEQAQNLMSGYIEKAPKPGAPIKMLYRQDGTLASKEEQKAYDEARAVLLRNRKPGL